MLLDDIHRKRDVIARLCQQYGARRLRMFGSVARREERVDSDVDFLVDFPRGYDLFAQRLPRMEKLTELLQRPVELIPEHELNRHIRDRTQPPPPPQRDLLHRRRGRRPLGHLARPAAQQAVRRQSTATANRAARLSASSVAVPCGPRLAGTIHDQHGGTAKSR